jgi:hypothetical protein
VTAHGRLFVGARFLSLPEWRCQRKPLSRHPATSTLVVPLALFIDAGVNLHEASDAAKSNP